MTRRTLLALFAGAPLAPTVANAAAIPEGYVAVPSALVRNPKLLSLTTSEILGINAQFGLPPVHVNLRCDGVPDMRRYIEESQRKLDAIASKSREFCPAIAEQANLTPVESAPESPKPRPSKPRVAGSSPAAPTKSSSTRRQPQRAESKTLNPTASPTTAHCGANPSSTEKGAGLHPLGEFCPAIAQQIDGGRS